jgi:hypothetical protein
MKISWRNLISISLFGICHPVSNAQRVLITISFGSTQWTCFDHNTTEDCCLSIQIASHAASVPVPSLTSCTSKLAKVPGLVQEALQVSTNSFAQYALTFESPSTLGQQMKQFLWDHSKEEAEIQTLDRVTSPYHMSAELSASLSIHSDLSSSGGMHRLLRHSLEVTGAYSTCYVFLTIPDGIFVDLDDAFEGSTGTQIVVHSAGVCDIEQPAFVSGQHCIVFEVRDCENDLLNFASKLHLRYPHPSPAREQFVYLPEPQLLCISRSGSLVGATQQKGMELVWVGAGNDDDYNMVVWTTVLVCLGGVVWMMADISHVARWDE